MTLRELQKKYVERVVDSVLESRCLDKSSLDSTIFLYLTMFTSELSRMHIIHATNTIDQLRNTIQNTSDTSVIEHCQSKISKVKKELGKWSTLYSDSNRENKYKKLRSLLKERGLETILHEFDALLEEENSFKR